MGFKEFLDLVCRFLDPIFCISCKLAYISCTIAIALIALGVYQLIFTTGKTPDKILLITYYLYPNSFLTFYSFFSGIIILSMVMK